jgi:PEP-CTERM motif
MGRLTRFVLTAIAATLAFVVVAGPASAATYSGVAFCNVPTSVSQNTPTDAGLAAAEALATECADFSESAINFSGDAAYPTNYNLNGFLTANGAGFGITYLNGFTGASDLNNTLWVFTGTASFTNGQVFNVVHDDGTEMYVNGVNVLNSPGPTPPITSTFTYGGPTGNFGFEFIFTECCGGQVDYQTTLVPAVSAVPEPGTLLLLCSGLFGIGSKIRRRSLAS